MLFSSYPFVPPNTFLASPRESVARDPDRWWFARWETQRWLASLHMVLHCTRTVWYHLGQVPKSFAHDSLDVFVLTCAFKQRPDFDLKAQRCLKGQWRATLGLEANTIRLESIASRLEAIASRLTIYWCWLSTVTTLHSTPCSTRRRVIAVADRDGSDQNDATWLAGICPTNLWI